jgi:hypothetical protein
MLTIMALMIHELYVLSSALSIVALLTPLHTLPEAYCPLLRSLGGRGIAPGGCDLWEGLAGAALANA